MMSSLGPWAIVASVGGGIVSTTLATLAFVARLIYTGKLVPKSLHDQAHEDQEKRVARAEKMADDMKTANETLLATVDKQTILLREIADTTKTTSAFINALPEAAQRRSFTLGSGPSGGGELIA